MDEIERERGGERERERERDRERARERERARSSEIHIERVRAIERETEVTRCIPARLSQHSELVRMLIEIWCPRVHFVVAFSLDAIQHYVTGVPRSREIAHSSRTLVGP